MTGSAAALVGACSASAAAVAVALGGHREAAGRLTALVMPLSSRVPGAGSAAAPRATSASALTSPSSTQRRHAGTPDGPAAMSPRLRGAASLAAGAGLTLVVNGVAGVVTGAIAALALHLWLKRLPPAGAVRNERLIEDELPLALDLLAACLDAGLPVATALAAVTDAVDPLLAARLAPVLTAFELGAGPVDAWQAVRADGALGPVARTLMRAGHTGAPSADVVAGLAARQRQLRKADYERAARAVGVWAVAPLTTCFLPAFVLVGVVPIIWGLVGGLL